MLASSKGLLCGPVSSSPILLGALNDGFREAVVVARDEIKSTLTVSDLSSLY